MWYVIILECSSNEGSDLSWSTFAILFIYPFKDSLVLKIMMTLNDQWQRCWCLRWNLKGSSFKRRLFIASRCLSMCQAFSHNHKIFIILFIYVVFDWSIMYLCITASSKIFSKKQFFSHIKFRLLHLTCSAL